MHQSGAGFRTVCGPLYRYVVFDLVGEWLPTLSIRLLPAVLPGNHSIYAAETPHYVRNFDL
jgi:hypothetical protein